VLAAEGKAKGKLSLDPATGATVLDPEDKWTKGTIKPTLFGAPDDDKGVVEVPAMTRKGRSQRGLTPPRCRRRGARSRRMPPPPGAVDCQEAGRRMHAATS
jgi:hypothetical protein